MRIATKDPSASNVEKTTAYVWDLPTRLFHWALVLSIGVALVTANIGGNAMSYHVRSGATVLGLLLFRLVWGILGSHNARFVAFLHGPAATWRYARGLLGPDWECHLGHNPLGGWSILAMLLALGLQVATGLFATDDIATQGPLNAWVSEAIAGRLTALHHFNVGVIIALVALHILAVLFYLLVKKENLVAPMITGRKPWPAPMDPRMAMVQPTWSALIVAVLCAAGIYFLFR